MVDLRSRRVGELIPTLDRRARRLVATAYLVPGTGDIGGYRAQLDARGDDFAAWDGEVVTLPADGARDHALVIVDRYGQVYESATAGEGTLLPDAAALEEWFKFLATACPECGVIDDPRTREWVP